MQIEESTDENWWRAYNELHPEKTSSYCFFISKRFSKDDAREIANRLVINSQETKFLRQKEKEIRIKMSSGIEFYVLIDKNGNLSKPNKVKEHKSNQEETTRRYSPLESFDEE